MPPHVEPLAADLIHKLLVVDYTHRLGCARNGAKMVQGHQWFHGIDWEDLLERKSWGPINPGVIGDNDAHNYARYSANVAEDEAFSGDCDFFRDF